MSEIDEKIAYLQARLDNLAKIQTAFGKEVRQIEYELYQLRQNQPVQKETPPPQEKPHVRETYIPPPRTEQTPPNQQTNQPNLTYKTETYEKSFKYQQQSAEPPEKSNIEVFIGRNLISILGIIITVIGVAIGAKYAIDRNLISPATRIISGYIFAFIILGFAVRLKEKYYNFSAVLFSGSMAMMYFLTYFAYDFYNLIPQTAAFAMMVAITAFTVAAAIHYNRQIIAHIGLVGAYAVPFLLSDGSGRVAVLFSYMTIVNFGILLVSVKKFWKPLYYNSFIFTWLIFSAWFLKDYRTDEHFALTLSFLSIFFATFYLTFVSYKLIAREEFSAEIVYLILLNSFIFYGFAYSILFNHAVGTNFLGLFTIGNAILHFLVAFIIQRYKLGGNINLYLPVALSLTFLTIAFPVQSGGKWLTLYWTVEALFLFAIGRTKRIAIFETFAFPVMFLACAAMFFDWVKVFESNEVITPFFNKLFVTSAIFTIAFGAICYFNFRRKSAAFTTEDLQKLVNFVLPAIFLFALYNTFRTEIGNYFQGKIVGTSVFPPEFKQDYAAYLQDSSLRFFNTIWQINYTMLFLTILSFINLKRLKSQIFGYINIILNAFFIFIFLTVGLYFISELRDNFLMQTDAEYFNRGAFHIVIRYISYIFAAGLIFAGFRYFKEKFIRETLPAFPFDFVFDIGFYFTLLWILSSELLNLLDIFSVADSYKLALSILWGIYALLLIVVGIYQKKKHLRIGAIVLFAITLVKLFFYDIAHLGTISKTIVFVSLGILLLIISFLYNKFKDTIFD